MCPFVEKKKRKKGSVVFSLTYKYKETAYTIFSTPSNPPIINNYYSVQSPSLLFQPLLLFRTRE